MKFCKFLLLCFFVLIAGTQAEAQTQKQVFLKLNQYYVFTPEPYYINNDNHFMVSLKVASDLMGAEVVFKKETKTAIITFYGRKIEFKAGSNKIIINGEPFTMLSKAIYDEEVGALFIPVYILIDAFNLDAKWHHKWKQLDISDERIMKTKRIEDLEGSDICRGEISNGNAFRIVHFALRKVDEEEMFTRMQIEFAAENITGYDIQEGKEDIHYWINLNHSFFAETDTREQRLRPHIKAGEITKRVVPFTVNKGDAVNYIMIWPRTF